MSKKLKKGNFADIRGEDNCKFSEQAKAYVSDLKNRGILLEGCDEDSAEDDDSC